MENSRYSRLPNIIIFAGILYSIFLLWNTQDEVFFSGDAGIKALLVKQHSRGEFSVDLRLSAETWVDQLWKEGFYPFKPPYVYERANRYFVTFPFLFPLISAPFYKLFGFKGLYIIPTLSLWILWLKFYSLSGHLEMGWREKSIALAILVFSSPLTLYGAMFWEHTLSVLLAFLGVDFLLSAQIRTFSKSKALILGVLTGLSVWARWEMLCMVGALGLLSLFLIFKNRLKGIWPFIIGMTFSIAVFWTINTLFYQHPLSAHSFQVLEDFSLQSRIAHGYSIFKALIKDLFIHFPILYSIGLYLLLAYFKNARIPPIALNILFLCIVFIITVLLILPSHGDKQWGPRFLLIIVPLVCLLAQTVIRFIVRLTNVYLRYFSLLVFLTCFAMGVYQNTYVGSTRLINDYRFRVLPALEFLQQDDNRFVAVSHEWIAQELTATYQSKVFFLIRDQKDLVVLARHLSTQGYSEFTFLCHPHQEADFDSGDMLASGIKFSKVGQYGSYAVYNLVDYSQDWSQAYEELQTYLKDHPGPELLVLPFTDVHPDFYGIPFQSFHTTPFRPQPGRYVLGSALLGGWGDSGPRELNWFRRARPTAIVGHSLLVYDVKTRPAWVSQCVTPAAPLSETALATGFGRTDLRRADFDCTTAWLYPGGGQRMGVYAFHHSLLEERRCGFLTLLECDPVPADPFIARHLDGTHLSYEQRADSLLPAFALYERDEGPRPLPALLPIWAAPADGPPGMLENALSLTLPVPLGGPLTFLGTVTYPDSIGGTQADLEVETWWRVTEGPVTRPLSLMAHLLTPEGQVLSVADGLGVSPVVWQAGDVIVQRHRFPGVLTRAAAGDEGAWGDWILRTGAYWLDTMQRWGVVAEDGVVRDYVLLAPLEVPDAQGVSASFPCLDTKALLSYSCLVKNSPLNGVKTITKEALE
jgi:hypothetical protein